MATVLWAALFACNSPTPEQKTEKELASMVGKKYTFNNPNLIDDDFNFKQMDFVIYPEGMIGVEVFSGIESEPAMLQFFGTYAKQDDKIVCKVEFIDKLFEITADEIEHAGSQDRIQTSYSFVLNPKKNQIEVSLDVVSSTEESNNLHISGVATETKYNDLSGTVWKCDNEQMKATLVMFGGQAIQFVAKPSLQGGIPMSLPGNIKPFGLRQGMSLPVFLQMVTGYELSNSAIEVDISVLEGTAIMAPYTAGTNELLFTSPMFENAVFKFTKQPRSNSEVNTLWYQRPVSGTLEIKGILLQENNQAKIFKHTYHALPGFLAKQEDGDPQPIDILKFISGTEAVYTTVGSTTTIVAVDQKIKLTMDLKKGVAKDQNGNVYIRM